jgi:hypothetical protein
MNGNKRISVRGPRRRGAVLVEFAIVAFVLYLIIAAIFTFGRALFIAESLQHTTDTFAHELARTPLAPNDTLADALVDPAVTQTLFNENALQIDISAWIQNDGGLTLDQYLQQQGVPLVNRLLAPLMIMDERADGSTVLWYPGAVRDPDGHYYVNVLHGDGTGAPTNVPVVEAVGSPDPFPLGMAPAPGSTPQASGLAGVRINYPYQSATLSAFTYTVNGTPISSPVGVSGVQNHPIKTNEALDIGASRGGLYGGPSHLGQQIVGPYVVRPFQRLISAQAVYRREVFGPEPTTLPGNP